MKIYFTFLLLLLLSCQKDSKQATMASVLRKGSSATDSVKQNSRYHCESSKFISVLEEIPNRDSDAYKLTITPKNGKSKIVKVLDIRPAMSQIHYCNDLYTEVGFACGGPCYSRVFIFTDKDRPNEQYVYSQKVKNNPNVIAHIKDEEFEKLIIHNFLNSKELIVDISDANFLNHGQMDSLLITKDNLVLYYLSDKNKNITKRINLKAIL